MLGLVIKERLVNVRLKPQTHEEFKIACDLRGASMSSLLHQFIVRTIREEKELSPHSFTKAPAEATLQPSGKVLTPIARKGQIGSKSDANKNAPKRKASGSR